MVKDVGELERRIEAKLKEIDKMVVVGKPNESGKAKHDMYASPAQPNRND